MLAYINVLAVDSVGKSVKVYLGTKKALHEFYRIVQVNRPATL